MREVLVSTIVRILKCVGCDRQWNWMDAVWPRHCPFCGAATEGRMEEVSKYVAKVPARG